MQIPSQSNYDVSNLCGSLPTGSTNLYNVKCAMMLAGQDIDQMPWYTCKLNHDVVHTAAGTLTKNVGSGTCHLIDRVLFSNVCLTLLVAMAKPVHALILVDIEPRP